MARGKPQPVLVFRGNPEGYANRERGAHPPQVIGGDWSGAKPGVNRAGGQQSDNEPLSEYPGAQRLWRQRMFDRGEFSYYMLNRIDVNAICAKIDRERGRR